MQPTIAERWVAQSLHPPFYESPSLVKRGGDPGRGSGVPFFYPSAASRPAPMGRFRVRRGLPHLQPSRIAAQGWAELAPAGTGHVPAARIASLPSEGISPLYAAIVIS